MLIECNQLELLSLIDQLYIICRLILIMQIQLSYYHTNLNTIHDYSINLNDFLKLIN